MGETIKLKQGTFKHVESEIYAYQDTLKEAARLREEILYGTSIPDDSGGGKSNLPGDPTGSKATRLATSKRIEHLDKITSAIQSVYESLPEEKQRLVKVKYWTKPQTLTWDGIALKMNVSSRQAMRWRDEIVYAIAERLGWR